MLAVLMIEMEWFKENRTPDGAVKRQQYYRPVQIEEDVSLGGTGIFLKKCRYYQTGNEILDAAKNLLTINKSLSESQKGIPFTGSDEIKNRRAKHVIQSLKKSKGSFYDLDKLDIPYVNIIEEDDKSYRIKWFDAGMGMPVRRGGNEDLYHKNSKMAGRPNLLNETAFILKEGYAGILKYNYRYTNYHGQGYKCYYVYLVNEKKLTRDIFLREYDYEYEQLADLF